MASGDEKICFVIAPIDEPESEIRRRSDVICKYIVEPAAESCRYKTVRADQIPESGMITTQVIQHLINDPMVVADLTGRNLNVYDELAIRHAFRKPFIQLIQKGEQIPFDISGMRCIPIDHQDIAVASEAKAAIISYMVSMQGEHVEVESPISVAVEMDILRRSNNPQDRQLADVLAAVTDLRTSFTALERKISDPANLLPPSYLRDFIGVNPSFLRDFRTDQFLKPGIHNRKLQNNLSILSLLLDQLQNDNLTEKEQMDFFTNINRTYNSIARRTNAGEGGKSDSNTLPKAPEDD